ncbi:MAG: DUF3078 domain-containing protein [Candidatus Cloacimonetes bacterium]|nr:DUF3078 domain-containing protein [Candidatus Cloacimonadota bacterium]MCF7815320.1 DUF3078 domain-containing protein [Candidatus Cloacimonadota bacterium]MCF7883307.1 DUF3078 domain-containing protein [Candidatus Cloacimonadota bacterium]
MKKLILLLSLIAISAVLSAEGWTKSADVSLNLNQNEYSDNWAGSELGSISWTFNANLLAEKQLNPKLNNKNTLKLAFGQTHNQFVDINGDRKWAKPEKSTDLIDFESMFRFTLGLVVDPFASFRWESQFIDERGNEIKNINPNIFTESFGVARMFIKEDNKELSARLGAALKQYFDGYADESSNDGGLEIVGEYKSPLAKRVISYNTKLIMYKALFYSLSDEEDNVDYTENWEAVRMDWEHILSASITKLINLNLYVQFIYDERQIDELQFKETLGLGFAYKLM